MLGFPVAVAHWAFEVGKGIADLDSGVTEELREEVALLRANKKKALLKANTSGSLLTTEKRRTKRQATRFRW